MSPNDSETIELWNLRKAAWEKQLATIMDPVKQVEIEMQIEICNQKIRELGGEI